MGKGYYTFVIGTVLSTHSQASYCCGVMGGGRAYLVWVECPAVWEACPAVWAACPAVWEACPAVWEACPAVWEGVPGLGSVPGGFFFIDDDGDSSLIPSEEQQRVNLIEHNHESYWGNVTPELAVQRQSIHSELGQRQSLHITTGATSITQHQNSSKRQ